MSKHATTDHPINEILTSRWSPYGFDNRPVAESDLRSVFEAARWSASSYNEQPWTYIVARQSDGPAFQQVLSCLAPGNQAWAKVVPVLALGVVKLRFTHNDKENRAAVHDLGLASASLVFEATSRGLSVHQMIGIVPETARTVFSIPQGYEAWTALAIGYRADASTLPDALKQRDEAPRQRKPLRQFVFGGSWGTAASFLAPE